MRKSVAVLSLALVASCLLSLQLWRELRAERALVEELRSRETAFAQPAAATGGRTPAAARPPPAPAPALVTTSPPPEPPAERARNVHGTQEEWDDYQRRLLQDPKFREARREELRLQFAARREDAIRLLGFTPGEADAAVNLMVETQLRGEIASPSQVDLSAEGRRLLQESHKAQEQAYQAELRQLLGADKGARWREYLDSLPTRGRVDSLRLQLTGADALREDQIEPLVAALHTERARMRQDLAEYQNSLLGQPDTDSRMWDRYSRRQGELLADLKQRSLAAAGAILSTPQLDRLEALLQREIDRHEANSRLIRIRSKLDSASRHE
jgi:hypothetical protein